MESSLNASLRNLVTMILHPRLVYLEEAESTNKTAKQLILEGEQEGLLVVAGTQSAGLGRHDRTWASPRGGIYLTIALEPRVSNESAPLLGLLVANATVDGINKAIEFRDGRPVNVRIKWPNDLLVEGRKVGGILSELVTREDNTSTTIIGLGLNVSFNLDELPDEIQDTATTILKESGVKIKIASLVSQIMSSVDFRLQEVERSGSFTATVDELRQNCVTVGKEVRITRDAEVITGIAIDIDERGSLVVESGDEIHVVDAGEVVHL